MTALVDVATYVRVSGDHSTDLDDVEAALADAQRRLEEHLDRPLDSAVRTETRPLHRDGAVYPKATPVASVATTGALVDGDAVYGVGLDDVTNWQWDWPIPPQPTATIVYTGGWSASTLPIALRNAIIALAAQTLLQRSSQVPAGARAVAVGDVSVSLGDDDVEAAVLEAVNGYRRREYGP